MIKIINFTKNPLTNIGNCAIICKDSKPKDLKQVALKCLEYDHGRALEFSNITLEISGYSARVIRELYTHTVGISKMQESTRYIDMKDFMYYIPNSVRKDLEALKIYTQAIENINNTLVDLKNKNIPIEDTAYLLPLCYKTKIVTNINVRALLHMAEIRMCKRALQEFRELMNEMCYQISLIDPEWNVISKLMQPKCKKCTEKEICH